MPSQKHTITVFLRLWLRVRCTPQYPLLFTTATGSATTCDCTEMEKGESRLVTIPLLLWPQSADTTTAATPDNSRRLYQLHRLHRRIRTRSPFHCGSMVHASAEATFTACSEMRRFRRQLRNNVQVNTALTINCASRPSCSSKGRKDAPLAAELV